MDKEACVAAFWSLNYGRGAIASGCDTEKDPLFGGVITTIGWATGINEHKKDILKRSQNK